MAEPFPQFIVPIPKQPDVELLSTYKATFEFYAEVQRRQDLDDYCLWYKRVSDENRRDLTKMRREFNIMKFFSRGSA